MCFVNKDNIERNKGNVEGINLKKIVFDVCVFMFCFFVCVWIDLVDLTPVKRVYEKEEFWNVHSLMTESDCPEMSLCGWQDVKI